MPATRVVYELRSLPRSSVVRRLRFAGVLTSPGVAVVGTAASMRVTIESDTPDQLLTRCH